MVGRLVTLAPGRDDTTREPPGAAGGVGDVGWVAVGCDDAGCEAAAGATGAAVDGADGAGVDVGAGVATGAAVVVTAGAVDSSTGAVAFLARGLDAFFASGASVPSASLFAAGFLAFFGFSAAGSRFKPFSSA